MPLRLPKVPKRAVEIAFLIAFVGPFAGWAAIFLALGVGLWPGPPLMPLEVAYLLHDCVLSVLVFIVFLGTIAAIFCAIFGTWPQRAILAILAILYAPLLIRLIPKIWG
jgi:hypothetical protein